MALRTEDKLQIIDVLIRYATAIDTRDWILLRTCFSDDFTARYETIGEYDSPESLTKFMSESHDIFGFTQHRLSNFAIKATAAGAASRTYFDAVLVLLEPAAGITHVLGHYDDQLVHLEGDWKIARRHSVLGSFNPLSLPKI